MLFHISISIFMKVLGVPPPSPTLWRLHPGQFDVKQSDFVPKNQILNRKSRFEASREIRSSKRLEEGGGTLVNVVPGKFKHFYGRFMGSSTFLHSLAASSRSF